MGFGQLEDAVAVASTSDGGDTVPVWGWVLVGIAAFLLLAYSFFWVLAKPHKRMDFRGRHCIVTGGSSGIGKEVALELARQGAHVTLIARNIPRLKTALAEISAAAADPGSQKFGFASVALGTAPFSEVQSAFSAAEQTRGPVAALFNVAGVAAPIAFDQLDVDKFEELLRTNLLSVMHATRAVLPGMKERGEGRLLFTSSMAGLTGIYGYTVYGATKFGMRGFAEALAMEVHPHGVAVSVSFPPDTRTPGFDTENAVKDPICKAVCEVSVACDAAPVAQGIVHGTARGTFRITATFDGWLAGLGTAGFSPSQGALDAAATAVAASVLRAAALVYVHIWYGIAGAAIRKQKKEAAAAAAVPAAGKGAAPDAAAAAPVAAAPTDQVDGAKGAGP